MRSQRGFVLACALIGHAGTGRVGGRRHGHPGQPERSSRPRRARGQARAHRGAAHRRARPRRPGRLEPVRHAVVARATRRRARRGRPGLERQRRRARVAVGNRSLFRLSSTEGLALVSDNALAGSATHAVTLRQTIGGLAASGGGLVTVGVTKAGGAWKVVSASSSLNGDETLDGKARLRDGQAWQAAAASVGRVKSLAQIARLRGKGRLRPGLEGPARRGPRRRAAAREVAFPTVSRRLRPGVRDARARHPGRRAERLPRLRRRAQRHGPRPREPRRQRERRSRGGRRRRRSFNGELPRRTAAATPRRARSPSPPSDGVRAIDVFANADSTLNDIVLKLLPRRHRGRRGRHGPHARAHPLRARRRRARRRLLRAGVRVRRRPAAGRAAHLHGHHQLRHERRRRRPTSRAGA